MAERPTIKLKPGAVPRNPQRLRVRATNAPRKAATAAQTSVAAAPAPARPKTPQRLHAPPEPPRGPRAAGPRPSPPRPAPKPARPPRSERRVLGPAVPATPAARQAMPRPRPVNSKPDEGIRLLQGADRSWHRLAPRGRRLDRRRLGEGRWPDGGAGPARVARAVIEIDPAARKEQARSVTILLNKPVGYVTGQPEDGYQPASVADQARNRFAGDAQAPLRSSPATFARPRAGRPARHRLAGPAGADPGRPHRQAADRRRLAGSKRNTWCAWTVADGAGRCGAGATATTAWSSMASR